MRNLRSNPSFTRAHGQRGMSLIEIIIVIVLIGAVLTFVGSRVIGGKDRGDYNLGKSAVQTLAGKIENFRMDTGRLPNSLDELVTAPGDASGWLGPYAKATELRDPFGHPYEYRAPGENGDFDLVFLGKDGRPGGTSTNADYKFE